MRVRILLAVFLVVPLVESAGVFADSPKPTREFQVKNDRPVLDGKEIKLWGLRCGNALHSEAITQRHITNLPNMAAHGINLIGVYIQGSNTGWPDPDASFNGFTRDGKLKPESAERLERFVRAADEHGMVVMIGLFTPRKDQEFYDEAAIQAAIEEAGKFLKERKLKNVFVDIMHEYSHPERIDHPIFREPDGANKKSKLTNWFKEVAPEIEVGVCPDEDSGTADYYPGMEVRIIQKEMPIPEEGFVVNVETLRQDPYQNDGIFNKGAVDFVIADCERYREAPNAAMLFHSAFIHGLTGYSGSAPHAEMGGYGTGPNDRGVRFYYDWVRDNVGRWEYPKHVKADKS